MNAKIAQYLNEIVSLSVMLLMVMALIAGQLSTTSQAEPVIDAGTAIEAPANVIQEPTDAAQGMDIDVLRLSIEINLDDAVVRELAGDWTAALGEQLLLRQRSFARRHAVAGNVGIQIRR